MSDYRPATRPTLHFIGVTTGKSSIMKVFPAWAEYLGLHDAVIAGIDFPLHAAPEAYRAAVRFIKQDPLSLGALVTTHKIDLYEACRGLFDKEDAFARLMGEASCISKRGAALICHAKDPISSGLAIDGFLPPGHFARTGAEVFSIGAGGSTIALTWHLMRRERGANVPSRIVVSNRSAPRLAAIERVHREIDTAVPVEYLLAPTPRENDAIVTALKSGSMVVNATGLGKDAPGSPISDNARLPRAGHCMGPQLSRRPRLPRTGARASRPRGTSRSRTAGPISCTAGRRSSPRSSTSRSRRPALSSTYCRTSRHALPAPESGTDRILATPLAVKIWQ